MPGDIWFHIWSNLVTKSYKTKIFQIVQQKYPKIIPTDNFMLNYTKLSKKPDINIIGHTMHFSFENFQFSCDLFLNIKKGRGYKKDAKRRFKKIATVANKIFAK